MICKTIILYKVKAKKAMCILYHSVAKHSNFSKLVLSPAKVNTGLKTHAQECIEKSFHSLEKIKKKRPWDSSGALATVLSRDNINLIVTIKNKRDSINDLC